MINVSLRVTLFVVVLNLKNSFSQLVALTNLKQEGNEEKLNFSQIIHENKRAFTYTDLCSLRIYGGREISIQSVPYQISLRRSMMGGMYWFTGCGGSLITLKYVLTAAHCFVVPDFHKLKNNIRAVAGTSKTDANAYTMLNEHWRRIRNYFYHKDYDSETFKHDIAVLEVSSPFILSERVQTIRMDSPYQQVSLKEGLPCLVTGYGYISKSKRPKKLQMVCVPLVSRFNCSYYYSSTYMHPSSFCAGTKDKDSCQGDSGGPIVCQGVLVGVVSFGGECGKQPGVYTRISSYTSGDLVPFVSRKDGAAENCTRPSIILIVLFLLANIIKTEWK